MWRDLGLAVLNMAVPGLPFALRRQWLWMFVSVAFFFAGITAILSVLIALDRADYFLYYSLVWLVLGMAGFVVVKRTSSRERNSKKTILGIGLLGAAIGFGYLVFLSVFSTFTVASVNMEPTLHLHQRIILNKMAYWTSEPQRGQVIAFHRPHEEMLFISRILALPGDTIAIKGRSISVNGQPLNEDYVQYLENTGLKVDPETYEEARTLKAGEIYVLGDNRNRSFDSRFIGPVDRASVVGRVHYRHALTIDWM